MPGVLGDAVCNVGGASVFEDAAPCLRLRELPGVLGDGVRTGGAGVFEDAAPVDSFVPFPR